MEGWPEKDAGGHPIWSGAVVGYVYGALLGLIPAEQAISAGHQLINDLLWSGMLHDYSQVETYARERSLPIKLAAIPVQDYAPMEGGICRDPVSGEARQYVLGILVGDADDDFSRRVKELNDDPENIARLESETGIMIISGDSPSSP